jgi:hypothetical protein
MRSTVHRTVRLSEDRARRLGELAAARGTTEDALIERALDLLFDLGEGLDAEDERRVWSALGSEAMTRVWDNDADAVYDDWKQLYGVPDR